MKFKSIAKKTAKVLVAVAAINLGLSVFDINLLQSIFGVGTTFAKIVYGIIGVSGVWALIDHFS